MEFNKVETAVICLCLTGGAWMWLPPFAAGYVTGYLAHTVVRKW